MPRPFHWRLLRFDLLYLMPWESGVVCRLIGGFWDIVRIKVFTDGRLDDWRKRLPTPLIYHIRGRYPRKSRMAVNSILFSPIDEHWSVISMDGWMDKYMHSPLHLGLREQKIPCTYIYCQWLLPTVRSSRMADVYETGLILSCNDLRLQ